MIWGGQRKKRKKFVGPSPRKKKMRGTLPEKTLLGKKKQSSAEGSDINYAKFQVLSIGGITKFGR